MFPILRKGKKIDLYCIYILINSVPKSENNTGHFVIPTDTKTFYINQE